MFPRLRTSHLEEKLVLKRYYVKRFVLFCLIILPSNNLCTYVKILSVLQKGLGIFLTYIDVFTPVYDFLKIYEGLAFNG